MAPQAQLEESANDRTRSEVRGPKRDSFPYRNRCKSPFLSDFFLKSEPYVHRPARKVVRQKKRTSDRQTKVFWPISSSAGTRFWTVKCQIPVANPLKSCPQNDRRISLKRSNKEHLRLLLGRWHSPQVASAAQPAPRVHSSFTIQPNQTIRSSLKSAACSQ